MNVIGMKTLLGPDADVAMEIIQQRKLNANSTVDVYKVKSHIDKRLQTNTFGW